jgi:hypothetical protein
MWSGADNQGFFVLGAYPPSLPKPVYVPMTDALRFAGAYVVEITGASVSRDKGRTWVPHDSAPTYCLLDTGTRDSYFTDRCKPLADQFTTTGVVTNQRDHMPSLLLEIGGKVRLTFHPSTYMVEASPGMYASTFHTGNPHIENLFSAHRFIMLGISHLQGLALHCDVEAQRIGFAGLKH